MVYLHCKLVARNCTVYLEGSGVENKPHRLALLSLILMVCMIRWAMCGNGVPIIGMVIIRGCLLMGVSGGEVMRECCVAARGTASPATAVPFTAISSSGTTTFSSISGSVLLCGCNPLPFNLVTMKHTLVFWNAGADLKYAQ
jgi:hypothetical protein